MITAKDLKVVFKNGHVGLDDMSFDIGNGIYGLLGENGAGKTTLMRVLTTIISPASGTVMFDDMPYAEKNYNVIRKKIGYLPQEINLYPNLTVEETLMYLGRLSGVDKDTCRKRVEHYLERTDLAEHKHKKNKQLSGGMKRRVGLIQALVNDPELLVIDEPTTGLDPEERVKIRKLLVDFSEDRTVLFSTHVVEDLAATTDRIMVMKKGRLEYAGRAGDLIKSAEGMLWNCFTANEEEARDLERRYRITSKMHMDGGVRFKILSDRKPAPGAVPAEVSLEDAYIFINSRK